MVTQSSAGVGVGLTTNSCKGPGIPHRLSQRCCRIRKTGVVILHTEGGHFAVDENGQLVEYNPFLHEISESGPNRIW